MTMEVHLTPEPEEERNDLAALSGCPADDLVHDAVAGVVDELPEAHFMLDRRYDNIKSGKVKLIDGEDAFAQFHERIEARRVRPARAGMPSTRKPSSISTN